MSQGAGTGPRLINLPCHGPQPGAALASRSQATALSGETSTVDSARRRFLECGGRG